jgi:DNA-binding Lrp family transcriptional regulator
MKIEKKIIRALEKNKEGLMLAELSDKVGVHRHTLTKYVYKLEVESRIKVRKAGIAKLCYLGNKK